MAGLAVKETPVSRFLYRDGEFVASDTPLMRSYYERVLSSFHGRVLCTGLGLGVAPGYLASLPAVESVEVWELDPEIAKMFGGPFDVRVCNAWDQAAAIFDCAFHDIWSVPWSAQYEARKMESRGLALVQVSLPLTFSQQQGVS
jgi:hypothetical protein